MKIKLSVFVLYVLMTSCNGSATENHPLTNQTKLDEMMQNQFEATTPLARVRINIANQAIANYTQIGKTNLLTNKYKANIETSIFSSGTLAFNLFPGLIYDDTKPYIAKFLSYNTSKNDYELAFEKNFICKAPETCTISWSGNTQQLDALELYTSNHKIIGATLLPEATTIVSGNYDSIIITDYTTAKYINNRILIALGLQNRPLEYYNKIQAAFNKVLGLPIVVKNLDTTEEKGVVNHSNALYIYATFLMKNNNYTDYSRLISDIATAIDNGKINTDSVMDLQAGLNSTYQKQEEWKMIMLQSKFATLAQITISIITATSNILSKDAGRIFAALSNFASKATLFNSTAADYIASYNLATSAVANINTVVIPVKATSELLNDLNAALSSRNVADLINQRDTQINQLHGTSAVLTDIWYKDIYDAKFNIASIAKFSDLINQYNNCYISCSTKEKVVAKLQTIFDFKILQDNENALNYLVNSANQIALYTNFQNFYNINEDSTQANYNKFTKIDYYNQQVYFDFVKVMNALIQAKLFDLVALDIAYNPVKKVDPQKNANISIILSVDGKSPAKFPSTYTEAITLLDHKFDIYYERVANTYDSPSITKSKYSWLHNSAGLLLNDKCDLTTSNGLTKLSGYCPEYIDKDQHAKWSFSTLNTTQDSCLSEDNNDHVLSKISWIYNNLGKLTCAKIKEFPDWGASRAHTWSNLFFAGLQDYDSAPGSFHGWYYLIDNLASIPDNVSGVVLTDYSNGMITPGKSSFDFTQSVGKNYITRSSQPLPATYLSDRFSSDIYLHDAYGNTYPAILQLDRIKYQQYAWFNFKVDTISNFSWASIADSGTFTGTSHYMQQNVILTPDKKFATGYAFWFGYPVTDTQHNSQILPDSDKIHFVMATGNIASIAENNSRYKYSQADLKTTLYHADSAYRCDVYTMNDIQVPASNGALENWTAFFGSCSWCRALSFNTYLNPVIYLTKNNKLKASDLKVYYQNPNNPYYVGLKP